MNTNEIVQKAQPTLTAAQAIIMDAVKNGKPIPAGALRVGGIAAMIVKNGTAILDNPEKFNTAQSDRSAAAVVVENPADMLALANGVLRFKSAERALSQVRKVETMLTAMTAAPKPRGRKSRTVETVH
jgi:hypothetical protein